MLTLHVAISFIALAAGAGALMALYHGRQHLPSVAVLLSSTALISLTGFVLPSPPGAPTPDPARLVGIIELVIVTLAALALYVKNLAGAWRSTYAVTIVLAVYFNVFVAVVQAFSKIGFLHALAPAGKEPPFAITQLVTLIAFAVIGMRTLKAFGTAGGRETGRGTVPNP